MAAAHRTRLRCLLAGSRCIVCSYVRACARAIGRHWVGAVETEGCVAGVPSQACCVSQSLWAESPWPTAICSEMRPLAGLCTGRTTAWAIGRSPDSRTNNPHMAFTWAAILKNDLNQYDFLSWKFELNAQKECALGVEETARRRLSHINVWAVAGPEQSSVPGSMGPWWLVFLDA